MTDEQRQLIAEWKFGEGQSAAIEMREIRVAQAAGLAEEYERRARHRQLIAEEWTIRHNKLRRAA